MGRRSRGGTARVLAGVFYAWTLIIVVGAGRLATIDGSERAGILVAWAALYAGTVLVPLSHRATGGGRFRFSTSRINRLAVGAGGGTRTPTDRSTGT